MIAQSQTRDDFFCTAHLRAGLAARSVRSGLATLGSQSGRFALELAGVMVMARLLTPADYGLIAMVAPIVGFAGLFKDMGLSTATVQKERISHEQVSALFWINALASVVLAAACCAISPLVGAFYQDRRTAWITAALAATFVLGGLTAQHTALLKRQMRFSAIAWIDLATTACRVCAGVLTAWLGWSYWALVAMALAGASVNCLAVWKAAAWRPGRPGRGGGIRDMVRFGGCLTASQVCNFASGNADKLLIGRLLGAGALGVYTRAFQLLLMPLEQVYSPLSAVLLPALSCVAADPERYRRAVRATGDILLLLITPLSAISIALAHETIAVFLGPEWKAAVPVFRGFGIVAIALPMNYLCSVILQASGRTDVLMRWAPASMIISLASIFAGVPWGIVGIATSWAIGGLAVRTPIFYAIVCRTSQAAFSDLAAPVLFYAAPFGLLLLGGAMLRSSALCAGPLAALVLYGSILAAGYGAYLRATGKHRLLARLLREGRKGWPA